MDPAKGIRAPDETVFREHGVGQGLRELRRRLAQRIFHHLPQLLLRQPLGRRIDRQNAEPRRRRLLRAEKFERGDLREGELPAAPVGIVRLAAEEDAPPFAQLALQKALVEPHRLRIARPIADERRQHRKTAPARRSLHDRMNDAHDRRARPGAQVGDPRDPALILVGARIVGQEVGDRLDAETTQCRRLLDTHAAHLIDAVL